MKTIKFSSKELARLKDHKLGEGACAEVFRVGAFAIKIFNENGDKLHREDSFSEIIGIENDTVVFPLCRVEIDGKIKGYAMQYIDGELLGDVVSKLDLDSLIEAIKKAESDVRDLSDKKVVFEDVNMGGLMWTRDGKLRIIDTDFFHIKKDAESGKINAHNQKHLSTMLELETGFLSGPLNVYLNQQKEYYELLVQFMIAELSGNNMSFTVLLEKAREIFQSRFGIKPKSIEEMENLLKENGLYESEEIPEDIDESIDLESLFPKDELEEPSLMQDETDEDTSNSKQLNDRKKKQQDMDQVEI